MTSMVGKSFHLNNLWLAYCVYPSMHVISGPICLQIKKKDVDNYKPGQGPIPSCHLLARVVDQNTTEPLQHTITLDGAVPPCNVFTIFIDPGKQ